MVDIGTLTFREIGILGLTYAQMVAHTKTEERTDLEAKGYTDAFIDLFMSAKARWQDEHPGKMLTPPKDPPPINVPLWKKEE